MSEFVDIDLTKAINDLVEKQKAELAHDVQASVGPHNVSQGPEDRAHQAQSEELFPDPGVYDNVHETEIRAGITQFNHYSENGPTYDPSGMYLCKTCVYRHGNDGDAERPTCSIVAGEITLRTGSCDLYRYGLTPSAWAEGIGTVDKEQAGYQERPVAKAFGCLRCQHAKMAKFSDHEGRVVWCTQFGCHVEPLACCAAHTGRDTIKTFQD